MNLRLKSGIILCFFLVFLNSCTTHQRSSKKNETPNITRPRTDPKGGMNSDLGDEIMEEAFDEEEKDLKSDLTLDKQQRNEFSIELEDNLSLAKDKKNQNGGNNIPQPSSEDFEIVSEKAKGKEQNKAEMPPAQVFRVRFKIKNNNNKAVWYIMPYQGATHLSENGRFQASSIGNKQPLSAVRYQGEHPNTELIELRFLGEENMHFRAFYVPANSSFTLANYIIDCWQDADKIELWAAKEMRVNDQSLLEDYLPFSALSSPDVVVRCSTETGCPWEDMGLGNALENASNEFIIKYIQAQYVKKYKVQLSK